MQIARLLSKPNPEVAPILGRVEKAALGQHRFGVPSYGFRFDVNGLFLFGENVHLFEILGLSLCFVCSLGPRHKPQGPRSSSSNTSLTVLGVPSLCPKPGPTSLQVTMVDSYSIRIRRSAFGVPLDGLGSGFRVQGRELQSMLVSHIPEPSRTFASSSKTLKCVPGFTTKPQTPWTSSQPTAEAWNSKPRGSSFRCPGAE